MVAIFIDNVSKQFAQGSAQTVAVHAVSLRISSGDLFFLLGPSGCGKTTLLRMIAGFTQPTAGRILFGERDMSAVPPHLRDTGMVFQSYALWPHMTVAQNVAFGLDAHGIREPERSGRVAEVLALVRMEGLADRKPNQLSGGQQQRVALARALAIRPQCLLLDEPLSNLDAKLRLEMRMEIRRIVKESGTTAIYVTHDQKEALSMADAIAVMRAGRVEQVGTPTELYRQPATKFVAGFVGESNFISGLVETISRGAVMVKTAAGPVLAASPASTGRAAPVLGSSACVAFRPEGVRIIAHGGPSPVAARASASTNRFAAKRLSTTYLGEMAEHLLAIPGLSEPVKCFEINPKRENAPAGQDVIAEIPQDQMILLASDA